MGIFTNVKLGCFTTTVTTLLAQYLADYHTPTDSWTCSILYIAHYVGSFILACYSCLVVYWVTLQTHAAWYSIQGYAFTVKWRNLEKKDAWGWPWDYDLSFPSSEDEYTLHQLFAMMLYIIALGANVAGMHHLRSAFIDICLTQY